VDDVAYWAVRDAHGLWSIESSLGEVLFTNESGGVITSLEADEGGVSFRIEDRKTGNARRFCCPLPKKGRLIRLRAPTPCRAQGSSIDECASFYRQ
jgi:hypothetical protein